MLPSLANLFQIIQILCVCLAVCLSTIGVKIAGPIMTKFGTHISGNGSYLKKLTPHPREVEVGILGGKKIKSPGNVMNSPEKSIKKC